MRFWDITQMVHAFKIDKNYFLYDVESGSLHLCDKLSFFIVQNLEGGKNDLSAYNKTEIEESKREIEKLKCEGLLFSATADYSKLETIGKDIKALCLIVSQNCNLKCGYCFAGGGSYNKDLKDMTIETAKASIDFLILKSDKKNLEVDFFGGEPLLNFQVVKDTVYYANEQAKKFGKEFKFTLTTNALLLNDAITEFLNLHMDNVVISIDGRTETHNNLRKTKTGSDSFDIVLKNALNFRKKRGDKNYYIRGTYTNLNLDFRKDIVFLNECGFDQISIEPVSLNVSHPLAIREEHLYKIKAEYQKFAKKYITIRKPKRWFRQRKLTDQKNCQRHEKRGFFTKGVYPKIHDRVKSSVFRVYHGFFHQSDRWFNFFHFMIDLKNSPCIKKRISGCGAGLSYLAVAANGDIYPCHQFVGRDQYLIGNVLKRNLKENVRDIFSANLLTKEKCQNCFAKYHCGGGCAASCIFTNNDINQPDEIACEILKSRLECALYIYAMENNG